MNIFCVHPNPSTAASQLCDQHLGKMTIESSQMLGNLFSPEELANAPKTQKGTVRKHSHFNHPSSKWVRQSKENAYWLLEHAFAMDEERQSRLGKPQHFVVDFLHWIESNIRYVEFESEDLQDFAIAIGEDKICRKLSCFESLDTVEKYHAFYINDKPFATWSCDRPKWMDKEHLVVK